MARPATPVVRGELYSLNSPDASIGWWATIPLIECRPTFRVVTGDVGAED